MVTKRAPAIALVLIVVAMVGSISFVSLASQSERIEPSSASVSGGKHLVTFYSAISSVGLQLQFELNTTVIQEGGALKAQVYLYNTLSQNLSLAPDLSANPNIVTWDGYDFLCGNSPVYDVFGFALYQGHYAPTNVSQAGTPLQMTPPSPQLITLCGRPVFGQYVKTIEFAPKSQLATLSSLPPPPWKGGFQVQKLNMQVNATTGRFFTESQETTDIKEYFNGISTTYTTTTYTPQFFLGCCLGAALNGYWMTPTNSIMFTCSSVSNANHTSAESLSELYCNPRSFSVGSYTLVAEDLWNDVVYAYFQVISTSQTSASSQVMMNMPVRNVLLAALAVTVTVTAAIVALSKIRRSSAQQNKAGGHESYSTR
jgi:hypothetical protein